MNLTKGIKMKKTTILLSLLASLFFSCTTPKVAPVDAILTKVDQDKLTPDSVLQILKDGNQRFVSGDMTHRDHTEQVRKSVNGQYPKAIVLSCVDSRVPVEDVFDRGIGDLFVARVAGNFVNKDILGSMEFATKVAGSKLVVVLGHEHCGAVKAAIDNVQVGNISSLVERIAPAVRMSSNFSGEKSVKNKDYVHRVCENNVLNTISEIRQKSSIINELEKQGKVKVVGAIYDMDSGKVVFL